MTFGSSMSHSSSKTRVSALEKLKQTNAEKLELETRKMEERIRSLKEKMIKEKEERERQGGTRWASGRAGPLTLTSNKKPKKTSPKERLSKAPRRIKVLSDEPLDNYIVRKPKADDVIPKGRNCCGQCEMNSSVWICRECSENYCDACFNQFHQKGALKRHTKISFEEGNIGKPENKRAPPTSLQADNNSPVRSYGETTNSSLNTSDNGQCLLNGSYNEEESTASFAKALQEWREEAQVTKNTPRNHVSCADTSCGTSNEVINVENNKKELEISFHNSMSYGDRLYLKKGRQDPSIVVREPGVNNKEEKKTRVEEELSERNNTTTRENEKQEDLFSPNYREMIQSLTKSNKDTPRSPDEDKPASNVSIIEVTTSEWDNEKEGTACIVEEYDKLTETDIRPASQHGLLSIQEMLPTGDFSNLNPLSNLTELESPRYVSPSLSSKPFSLVSTKKQPKQPKPPNSRKPNKKRPVNYKEQPKSQIPVYQAWRPKPTHKDMSEFFLAGVKEDNESGIPLIRDDKECSLTEYSLSKGNLPTTWNPQHSYLVHETTPYTTETKEHNLSSTQSDLNTLHSARESHSDQETRPSIDTCLPSNISNQSLVTPGSDEDLQEIPVLDLDDFGTGDQDEDDHATLHDLDWELASSTGRLTRCDQDILDLEESDDDSVEDKECGSGLTTPRTLERSPSFHESMMDDFEEMERKFLEEEF